MTEKHDEALVERVAIALKNRDIAPSAVHYSILPQEYRDEARAAIYPPKTRLQAAQDLWKSAGGMGTLIHDTVAGKAILAALAMDKMED